MQYPTSSSEAGQQPPAYESEFLASRITQLAHDINLWAVRKGFWKFHAQDVGGPVNVTPDSGIVRMTKLMLVVTELAECAEGLRKPVEASVPGFTNEEEEIADAIIRLLDYAGQYRLRIGEALNAKMAKNEGRPYRHGKEF
jgi:NTP pyrophosphatase (non-canonical NTP hydrolase)